LIIIIKISTYDTHIATTNNTKQLKTTFVGVVILSVKKTTTTTTTPPPRVSLQLEQL
jgi:hypothetical protein